jgi:hypothetical protein
MVACSTNGRYEKCIQVFSENLKGKDDIEDLGIDRGCGLTLCGSGYGLVADTCEHSTEPLGSTKGGNFLTS